MVKIYQRKVLSTNTNIQAFVELYSSRSEFHVGNTIFPGEQGQEGWFTFRDTGKKPLACGITASQGLLIGLGLVMLQLDSGQNIY